MNPVIAAIPDGPKLRADSRPRSRIPREVRSRKQWVVWRYETRNGKRTKVPHQVNGQHASVSDPATWTSFEAAQKTLSKGGWDGVGYVFSAGDSFAGIDLDNSLDDTGKPKAWAAEILARFGNTYTEISPSGRGVKIWVQAKLSGAGSKFPFGDGAIEVYDRGRFFTVTAKPFDGADRISEHQADVDFLLTLRPAKSSNGNANGLIKPGERHDYAIRKAGRMHALGFSPNEIDAAIHADNVNKFSAPKPDAEMSNIVDYVATRPRTPTYSDLGNAEAFIAECGEHLRYCPALKSFLFWDGTRWLVDRELRSEAIAQDFVRRKFREAANAEHPDRRRVQHFLVAQSDRAIGAMLRLARANIVVSPETLDTQADLLNLKNGTLDLRSGVLREHRRADLITKMVPHNFVTGARCPLFKKFLLRVMGGDTDRLRAKRLIRYIQRALGYSLTAYTNEKAVFFVIGPGGDNGKTTLLSVVLRSLGDYAATIQAESLFSAQESNNSAADLADLRGARFVTTSELDEGVHLREGKLKRITQGQGVIKTARKYENPIAFAETHKLWVDANHRPIIRGTDDPLWRRIHFLQFDVTIPKDEQDRELPQKLQAEAEGILAWIARGAKIWFERGLQAPAEVRLAVRDYRRDMDILGRFIEEQCKRKAFERAGDLYSAFSSWLDANGLGKWSSTALGRKMRERGFVKKHTVRGEVWIGITLKGGKYE